MGFSNGNATSHLSDGEVSQQPIGVPSEVHDYSFYQLVELVQKLKMQHAPVLRSISLYLQISP